MRLIGPLRDVVEVAKLNPEVQPLDHDQQQRKHPDGVRLLLHEERLHVLRQRKRLLTSEKAWIAAWAHEEANDKNRPPLPQWEKLRATFRAFQQKGQCRFCGLPGHDRVGCPLKLDLNAHFRKKSLGGPWGSVKWELWQRHRSEREKEVEDDQLREFTRAREAKAQQKQQFSYAGKKRAWGRR